MRLLGTTGVLILLTQPLWAPQWGGGILTEIAGRPPWISAAIVLGFLGLVALYCRTLQRTLTTVRPWARRARPASVWWMFAVPHNFVEDFFIVRAVAASLAADGVPPGPVRRWSILGFGWCAAQIVSLLPGVAGLAGGAVALPLWAVHWHLTVRLNAARARRPPAGT
ncbi:hypothetical protein GCM10025331_24660 [Actinoplanes utahensis]|nr:hypothetical protein Aut01nite_05100 [Actinoplanes utahensis]